MVSAMAGPALGLSVRADARSRSHLRPSRHRRRPARRAVRAAGARACRLPGARLADSARERGGGTVRRRLRVRLQGRLRALRSQRALRRHLRARRARGANGERLLDSPEGERPAMTATRLFAAVAALTFALMTSAVAASTSGAPTSLAKKRCHIVKKKVHGKVKRVRVCTKPKPKPKPKNVSVSLEQSGQREVSIGEAGGSISAGAASGAKLTLSIPVGALAEETQIKLTPVSAVRGLTKIRLVAGAQFAPEGLTLAKPATLTLETSKAGGARALAWFGVGKDVFRYPSKRSGTKIQILITHFSGVGMAQGPASAWNGVPAATTALRAFYASDIKPLMNRALRFDQALERCTAGHDLSQARRMLSLARLAELMGIKLQGQTLFDRLEKCMRFELDFETTLTGTDEPAHLASWTSVVHAAVPVRLNLDFSGNGEAQLDYATWDYSFRQVFPGVCTLTARSSGVRLGTPFQVFSLTLDFGDEQTGAPTISMRICPG